MESLYNELDFNWMNTECMFFNIREKATSALPICDVKTTQV